MGYKEILVHVDNAASTAMRLKLAVSLARQFEGFLVGLYVDAETVLPTFSEVPTNPVIIETIQKEIDERARRAQRVFDEAIKGDRQRGEWRRVQGYPANSVTLHGRYADLIVVGQGGEDDALSMSDGVADAVMIEAGRPVLVVPWIGPARTFGKRILIAWNGSREAARAVHDALPLLRAAEHVQVLVVNPEEGGGHHGQEPGADICHHLSRHAVRAEAHAVRARDIDAGDVVLSEAAQDGSDLVVMGGYGRSRIREVVLGGVTRHLLAHMTVPVLFSH